MRNVRVLATDQRIDSKGEDGKTEVKTFQNVTVEVTPRIAEKVAVSQSMGTLTLSLRSIADNTAELERAVASGEVRLPPGTNPAEERRLLLAVANRPNDSNTTYTTGGDVSRFQRRTVPARPPSRAGRLQWRVSPRHWAGRRRPGGAQSMPVPSSALPAAIQSPSFRWEHANMTSRNIHPPGSPRHRPRRARHRLRAGRRLQPGARPVRSRPIGRPAR